MAAVRSRSLIAAALVTMATLAFAAAAAGGARSNGSRDSAAKRIAVEITIKSRSQCDALKKAGINPCDCAPGKITRGITAAQLEALRASGVECVVLPGGAEKAKTATKMRSHFQKK